MTEASGSDNLPVPPVENTPRIDETRVEPVDSKQVLDDAFANWLRKKTESRRNFLRRLVKGAVYGLSWNAVKDMGVKAVWEALLNRPNPELAWVGGQEESLDSASSMVVCLSGAATGTARDVAHLEALQELGPVSYINYSAYGLKLDKIAGQIKGVLEKHKNIQQFSLVLQSGAALFGGGVIDSLHKLGIYVPLEYVILDHPITDGHLVRDPYAGLEPVAKLNDAFGGSSDFTELYNFASYGNPFYADAAPPDLLEDQLNTIRERADLFDPIPEAASTYQTRVVYIRPKDPKNDPFVRHEDQEPIIKKRVGADPGGPNESRWYTIEIEHNQGHTPVRLSSEDYNNGLRAAFRKLGRRRPDLT